ncbi:L,D-transpeptidase [Actinospica durhamensis]|uniref:L,D-transpeptidase n=1 Tax=Actinospica durhamensis TaxID=1508375 RepID=A0A941EIZ4_9ACTN|nr:L,D-transpeptidase [Actinospica durhamensis]MBR7832397.1 L,D-transpeptidase [Actinospica durhamensis]
MMTIAALAGVGILAAQAEATAPHASANSAAKVSATSTNAAPQADALPANSGSGTRIVYSPSLHRVWLVQGSTVSRTMQVVPGTVTPPAGTYPVYAKSPGSTGGDGVSVVYLVRFDSSSSTVFGFDAEAGLIGMPPAPKGHTGGVRMEQTDAQVLYQFAAVGTDVVVV